MYILEKSTLIYSVWKHIQREKLLGTEQIQKEEYYKNSCSKEQHIQMLFFTLLAHFASHERVENLLIALGMDGKFEIKNKKIYYNLEPLKESKNIPKGSIKQQQAFMILQKAFSSQEAFFYYKEFKKHLDFICDEKETCTLSQKEILHWLAKEIGKHPLKRICKVLNLSQKALAECLHVSEVTVNRWSSNENAIPSQSLRMFDILEENAILKEKQKKTQELLAALKNIQESY